MPKLLSVFVILASILFDTGPVLRAQPSVRPAGTAPAQDAAAQALVLRRYCFSCHNERTNTAGLALDRLDTRDVGASAETWEKVVRKLRSGTMPPANMPRPDHASYEGVISWLEGELDRAAERHPNPGRTETFHRLNRAEYQNAVRDLLGLEGGVDYAVLLPTDDASYGFDNIAGITKVTPALLERYAVAARKISRWAVGDPTVPPSSDMYRLSLDLTQEERLEGGSFGTRGGVRVQRYFPVDGDYVIKFAIAHGVGAAASETNELEVSIDGARQKVFEIKPLGRGAMRERDLETLELRLPVKAGLREVTLTFVRPSLAEVEEMLQPFLRTPGASLFGLTRAGSYNGHYVSWMSVAGPYTVTGVSDTPTRNRIFACRPDAGAASERACAIKILSTLARRGYRRPVTDVDMQRLLEFYEMGRAERGFEKGIQTALERLLTSPDFLFRITRDPAGVTPGTPYRVSDVDLASRLSFFLWSSIPDDELIQLAEEGKLSQPGMLATQVSRLLADPRSNAFIENFAGQWLLLRNVPAAAPNQRLFPDFDENLRQAFRRETELFFESVLREGRSVVDLLSADYTFVNERLARHYGIPGVYGPHFRRVMLPSATHRGGLLSQGSILTVTSYATRTSPVNRGKWVLENVSGTPPPPPPPDVPALQEQTEKGQALSMRQAMEMHRKNPVCASCHRPMDPLGFALENFDAVGKWRTVGEDGSTIDASGNLPDGSKFDGVAGLRNALVAQPRAFVSVVVEKLMTYALGRGIEDHDAPAVRKIERAAAADGYRLTSLIEDVIKSDPFMMRRSALPEDGSAETLGR